MADDVCDSKSILEVLTVQWKCHIGQSSDQCLIKTKRAHKCVVSSIAGQHLRIQKEVGCLYSGTLAWRSDLLGNKYMSVH